MLYRSPTVLISLSDQVWKVISARWFEQAITTYWGKKGWSVKAKVSPELCPDLYSVCNCGHGADDRDTIRQAEKLLDIACPIVVKKI